MVKKVISIIAGVVFILGMLVSCNTIITEGQSGLEIDDSVRAVGMNEPPVGMEESYLLFINAAWERFERDDTTGINWRRFNTGHLRTDVFDQALIAYWNLNSMFPQDDEIQPSVNKLKENGLLPFWPIDPESGEKIRIVENQEEVFEYSDLYIEHGDSNAFDYTLMMNDANTTDFARFRETRYHSTQIGNHSRYTHVDSDPEHGVEQGDYENPSNSQEVFSELVRILFEQIVAESFKSRGGYVPGDLGELLNGSMEINTDGWRHPTGPLDTGEPGNFEYGVDPVLNGYYLDFTTSRSGRMFLGYKFIRKETAGEMVYELMPVSAMLAGAREEEFTARIPLLTDELFAGPAPQL